MPPKRRIRAGGFDTGLTATSGKREIENFVRRETRLNGGSRADARSRARRFIEVAQASVKPRRRRGIGVGRTSGS